MNKQLKPLITQDNNIVTVHNTIKNILQYTTINYTTLYYNKQNTTINKIIQ